MSNVIERYRKTSKMEFFHNAVELRDDMTRFLMREKNVPKKYRAIATYPLLDCFEEMFELMRQANRIYTDTEEKVSQRRAIQKDCLNKLEEIYWLLQRAVGLLWKDKLRARNPTADQERLRNALNDFASRMKREEELLIGWRNGTQLIKKKS